MVKERRSLPLLIELVKYPRVPVYWVILTISCIMIPLLVIAAYLDGVFADLLDWEFWRNYLDAPVLITYGLVGYTFIWRLWQRSAQTIQLNIPLDDSVSGNSEVTYSVPNRRREWIAMFFGAAVWLTLWQPWIWREMWRSGAIWLPAYEVLTQTILYGLICLLIYNSFSHSWYLNGLIRRYVKPDIFNIAALAPVARSSLGFSIGWIGGISLSLVFQTHEDLLMWKNIVVWTVLVCFAVLIFFLSLWSTHRTIVRVKNEELELVQKHLRSGVAKMKQQAEGDKGKDEPSSSVTAWLHYERRIKEVPEWPYNAGIIRSLLASTIVPALVYLLKILFGLRF